MPTITADKISTIAREVLHAAGASEGHARTVGTHLANANLAGHDSHGFIRIIQYVSNIRQGTSTPRPNPRSSGTWAPWRRSTATRPSARSWP